MSESAGQDAGFRPECGSQGPGARGDCGQRGRGTRVRAPDVESAGSVHQLAVGARRPGLGPELGTGRRAEAGECPVSPMRPGSGAASPGHREGVRAVASVPNRAMVIQSQCLGLRVLGIRHWHAEGGPASTGRWRGDRGTGQLRSGRGRLAPGPARSSGGGATRSAAHGVCLEPQDLPRVLCSSGFRVGCPFRPVTVKGLESVSESPTGPRLAFPDLRRLGACPGGPHPASSSWLPGHF